jgi:WD40 repeat protein
MQKAERCGGHRGGGDARFLGCSLLSGADSGVVALWDVATGAVKARFNAHADSVRSVCAVAGGGSGPASGEAEFAETDSTRDASLSETTVSESP